MSLHFWPSQPVLWSDFWFIMSESWVFSVNLSLRTLDLLSQKPKAPVKLLRYDCNERPNRLVIRLNCHFYRVSKDQTFYLGHPVRGFKLSLSLSGNGFEVHFFLLLFLTIVQTLAKSLFVRIFVRMWVCGGKSLILFL